MSRLERIVAACGGVLLDGGSRALIPGPGHSHKDRSVSLVETDEGRLIIHCFSPKDDWRAVRDVLRARRLLDSEPCGAAALKSATHLVVQPRGEERGARAARFWGEARALRCTPGAIYLNRRAIAPVECGELRFHPRMTSLDDRFRRPALLAAVRDGEGALVGVQVTLLSAYGRSKAPVATPRRIIGRLLGGAVRLFSCSDELVIAEGVESALSAAAALRAPAWAVLTAHNLSLFWPPPGVKRLIVAADRDAAGRAAACAVLDRAAGAVDVELRFPPAGFNDWNDAAASSGDAAMV